MCRSDRFKRIRDNYQKISSESYARKLKKEEAALAKLKADGKLKESEYNQQLLSLRENYEKQLDNLEIYIDRFARIDLSEISSVEQEIIELVQQGKIDEAIQRYEDLNIEDNLVDGINQLDKVKSTISQLSEIEVSLMESRDSLYAMATRQIENLLIYPDDTNIEKAKSIYCQLADNDPDNIVWLWKTGDFLSSSLVADHNLALHYYEAALESALKRHDEGHPDVANSYSKIAKACESIGNLSYAIEYYTKALNILEKINGCDHPEVLKIRARISSLNSN